jgi:hypothetical protein
MYSILARLLRYLYDFPRPICHTAQRRGEQHLVNHAHDVTSGTGLRASEWRVNSDHAFMHLTLRQWHVATYHGGQDDCNPYKRRTSVLFTSKPMSSWWGPEWQVWRPL